jgi:hypothetical protein
MNMLLQKEDGLLETRRWSGQAVDPSHHGTVKLTNAGLDDRGGEIVAHGWLDLDSMNLLRIDDYQREVLASVTKKKKSLAGAIEDGVRLPDIMLGMRGQRMKFPKGTSVCELLDNTYIVDGLQRIFALKAYAEKYPDQAHKLRIGAEVRFGTTRESEKDLFEILNTRRTPVSPNVIMRNLRDKHPGILTMYGLTHTDENFALYKRVSWNQRMNRGELITAMTFAKAVRSLFVSGRGENVSTICQFADKAAKESTLAVFRSDIVEFFEVIDQCWGIRSIEYAKPATHLKGNFLTMLGAVFKDHANFWNGKKLVVSADLKRKMRTFPIADPEITRLCSSGTMAVPFLGKLFVDHINKGKREHRLVKRETE